MYIFQNGRSNLKQVHSSHIPKKEHTVGPTRKKVRFVPGPVSTTPLFGPKNGKGMKLFL